MATMSIKIKSDIQINGVTHQLKITGKRKGLN